MQIILMPDCWLFINFRSISLWEDLIVLETNGWWNGEDKTNLSCIFELCNKEIVSGMRDRGRDSRSVKITKISTTKFND